jgi:DNA-binding response OmpR family regulator
MQEKKGSILLVDNDTDTCEMVTVLLGNAGYEIITISSIAESLLLTQNQSFDLILLDWYLEDGIGLDLCRQIRQYDEETPIFFYTGVAYPAEIRQALQAGAQGCFIKPVDVNHLLQTIAVQITALKDHDQAG